MNPNITSLPYISKREYFAIHILIGLCAKYDLNSNLLERMKLKEKLTDLSYELADEMIKKA